jgi:uncharacterized protein (TIGR00369 family)
MSTHGFAASGLDIARIEALIDDRFPQIHSGGRILTVEEIGARSARVRMRHHERSIRPGGTVAGPAMFTLADFSVYVAIIATLGEAGIDAVTTNLNINFLTKPEARDMLSSVRLIRVGRRLAVGEAQLYSDGMPDMVAHAIATYALPIVGG